MSITLRPARPGDETTVLGFIRGLAEYEELLDEAVITEADVARDLFGPAAKVFCDIAEIDGAAVGLAIWFYSYSTFKGRHGIYLEDLFVVPEARGKGAGLALLKGLARRCADEGLARLEWQVLDWNAPAIGFYDRIGATAEAQWIPRRMTGEALKALAS